MNYEQAKAAALAAGWAEADITPAVLRQYSWSPSDPLAGVVLDQQPVSVADAKDHLAALVAEAESQGVGSQVIGQIVKFGGLLISMLA